MLEPPQRNDGPAPRGGIGKITALAHAAYVNESFGGECVAALLSGGLASEHDETRLRARAACELVAGLAGDIRRLKVGFIE